MESPWKIQTTWKYVLCRCIFSTFFLGKWLKKDLYCHVGYSNWMVFPIFNNFIKKKLGSTNFCKIHDRIVCSHCCWGQQFCKNLQFSNNFMQYPFCKHHVFPNHFVVVLTQYPFCKVLQYIFEPFCRGHFPTKWTVQTPNEKFRGGWILNIYLPFLLFFVGGWHWGPRTTHGRISKFYRVFV